jgi:hypothetical protein
MKRSRILVISGAIIGLAALLFVLALTPAVQTAVVRRVLARLPDTEASLGRFSAGFGGVSVEAFTIRQPGMHLKLESLDLRGRMLAAALGGDLDFSRLEIRGLDVDLSEAATERGGQSTEAAHADGRFRGFLAGAGIGRDLRMGEISVSGTLRPPSEPMGITRVMNFRIRSSGISPGREAKIQVDIADADPARDLSRFRPNGTVVLMITPETGGRISSAGLITNLRVIGPYLQEPFALAASASIRAEQDREVLSFTLRPGSEIKDFIRFNGTVKPSSGELEGRLSVAALRADLPVLPPLSGGPVPDFAIAAESLIASNLNTGHLACKGSLTLATSVLTSISPQLAALGGTRLTATFDLQRSDGGLVIRELKSEVSIQDGATSVVSAEVSRPLRIGPGGTLSPEGETTPRESFASVSLMDISPVLISTFIPGLQLDGKPITGRFSLRPDGEGVAVQTDTPLEAPGLSVVWQGDPILRGVDLRASVDGTASDSTLDLKSLVTATSGSSNLLSSEIKIQRSESMSITYNADIDSAALARQPAVASRFQAASGSVRVTGAATLPADAAPETVSKVIISHLSPPVQPDGTAVGSISAELEFKTRGERIEARGPITLSSPPGAAESIDLTASVTLGSPSVVTALLSGRKLSLDPLIAVTSGFVPPDESSNAPASTASSRAEADPAPVWAAVNGSLALKFDEILLRSLRLNPVDIEVAIEPEAIRITRAILIQAGQTVNLAGALTFEAANPRPYVADFQVRSRGFDIGAFLAAQESGKQPIVTGTADVDAGFRARAAKPGELANDANVGIQLTGTNGTLRMLGETGRLLERVARTFEAVDRTAAAASQVAGLAGALGLLSPSDTQRAAEITAQAEARLAEGRRHRDLVQFLAAMPFESMKLNAALSPDGAIQVTQLDFLSSLVRLNGSGSAHLPGSASWSSMPVDLSFGMQARGSVADLMPRDRFTREQGAEWSQLSQPLRIRGNLGEAMQQQVTQTLLPALLR